MNKEQKELIIYLIGELEANTTRSKKENLRRIAELEKRIQLDQEEKDKNTEIYISLFFAFLFGLCVGLMINDNTPETFKGYDEMEEVYH